MMDKLCAWLKVATLSVMGGLLVVLGTVSCSEETVPNQVTLQTAVSATNSGQFISIESAEKWTIELVYPQGVEPWCRMDPDHGEGSMKHIQMLYAANKSTEARELVLRVVFDSETVSVKFVQAGVEDDGSGDDPGDDPVDPDTLISDPVHEWMELPRVETDDMTAFVSHRFESADFTARNYSMLYDAEHRIALWVAYPLTDDYIGSSGRTDDWGYDPKIPERYQAVMYSGLGNGFDRGHQLPSADRTQSRSLNRTTFYFTNMTPQRGELNQRAWANLENRVRGYASTCDTLYVVTGAVLTTDSDSQIEYTKDNRGNNVAVPKAYYKVLMKYNLASDRYSAIGFWFEHRGYGSEVSVSETQTVREIEERTGFDFFTNLPESIAEQVETEYNPGAWGF